MQWRPVVLAFGAGLLAVSIGLASAATLGVLDTRSLGTSSTVVAACDSTLGISWDDPGSPSFQGSATVADSTFSVTRLILTNVDIACNGQRYGLVIADSSGAALVSQRGPVVVVGGTATFTFAATNARNIDQVTLTIFQ